MRQNRLFGLCVYSSVAIAIAGTLATAQPVAARVTAPPRQKQVRAVPRSPKHPPHPIAPVQIGVASWYGPHFQGHRTADGERFDMHKLTAAHRTLPLGTRVRVTNLKNGRSVEVTINDRGPVPKDRVIDLSKRAAQALGMTKQGLALVRVDPIPADLYALD